MSFNRKIRLCYIHYGHFSGHFRRLFASSVNDAIAEAESVLGYSLKDLSVKEIIRNSSIKTKFDCIKFSHSRNHPVAVTERKLDPENIVNHKSRALLSLLLAKVAGVPQNSPTFKHTLEVPNSSLASKQLLLAETIELLHAGCLFHSSIVSPLPQNSLLPQNPSVLQNSFDQKINKELLEGNRLAVLKGDLMLTLATKNLIKLRNNKVSELLSESLKEFIEGEFLSIDLSEHLNRGDWDLMLEKWVKMTSQKYGKLIANGFKSMIHLAGHCDSLEDTAFQIGNNLAFAWQIHEDLQAFSECPNICSRKGVSLPILLHLQSYPHFRDFLNQTDRISFYEKINIECAEGVANQKAKSLLVFYVDNALNLLNNFQESDAKHVLSNIILSLKQN